MKNTDETSAAPGAVLISWSAGRRVCAVVCTAPATRPSTSSSLSIIVPRTTVSLSCSRAMSAVAPLCLRRATYGVDVPLGHRLRVDHRHARRQREAESPCLRGNLVRLGKQHALGETALGADDGGVQSTRLGTLGQHDPLVRSTGCCGDAMAKGGRAEPVLVRVGDQAADPRLVEVVGNRTS